MKYLIVGLGNIGDKYQNTRHNIGFQVLDKLANLSNTIFETQKLGDVCKIKIKGKQIILLKPSTFMNLSGKAVNYWLQKEKIPIDNILVITDDLALPFGSLRLKGKGSDGGHNGLKNIIETLGTSKYSRLRFGISSEFNPGKQVNYVLGEWSELESKTLPERILKATEIIKAFCTIGLSFTMNQFNNK